MHGLLTAECHDLLMHYLLMHYLLTVECHDLLMHRGILQGPGKWRRRPAGKKLKHVKRETRRQ